MYTMKVKHEAIFKFFIPWSYNLKLKVSIISFFKIVFKLVDSLHLLFSILSKIHIKGRCYATYFAWLDPPAWT